MKLTKQLKTDLANAYQCVMEVSLLDMKAPLRYINHYIAENVSGYGTAADEKIQSREDFRKMVMTARQQTKGMLFIAKIITAHQPKFIDDTTALFRDEIVVQIGDKKNKHSLHLWFSALFKYQHNKWQLVMFHGSMPDAGSSTEDTFHVREAEKKLKELELVVAQRTADLQTKTRELEIEASLERVRAAAMGMYKPDDLLNIAQVLFKEIVALGFTNIRCALIHIFNDKERYFFDYDYSDFTGGKITHVPYKGNKTVEKFLELVRHSDDAFVKVVMKGKEFTEWKLFRKRSGQLHDERMTKARQLNYYFYSIGAGNIGLSTFGNITAEQLEILKRFRNVFDFSYRRYLDIEKAEAQTREAQIELALERVRAKSLAMHTTSELQEVVATVHRELLKLDIGINGGSFIAINNDIDKELHCWGSGGTADTLNEVQIPYYNKPFYTNLVKRIKKAPSFFTEVYSQKEKKEFFTFLFKYDPWSKLKAKEKKETLSSPGGYTRSCCVSKHTSIFIINHFGEKFSDAENDILKRFANVFEQTYTRFLDLKKAESQAKEAQIQLGLERVRARTMAMQNSDELSEVSFLLDTQVRSLGIKTQGCAFNIYGPEESTEWFSNEIGTMPAYKTPMKDLFLRYYEAGKNGELMHIEKFEGDACVAHYEYLCTIPGMGDGLKAMIEAGGSFPKRQTDHVVYFKYGYVLFLTLEDVPEAHNIFIRFGESI